jgi:hypothetical protein
VECHRQPMNQLALAAHDLQNGAVKKIETEMASNDGLER